MVSELKNYLGGRNPYLGLVHRLDQPVSGILVFAKTPQAAAKLSQQAAAHGEAPQGGKNQMGKQKKNGNQKPGKEAIPSMEKGYMALVYTGTKRDGTATEQIHQIQESVQEPGLDEERLSLIHI